MISLKIREYILISLLVISIIFIHPFNKDGLILRDVFYSGNLFYEGDYLYDINNIPVKNITHFETLISELEPNQSVSVTILRENIPYFYRMFTDEVKVLNESGKNNLGFYVYPSSFSNLKFSTYFSGYTTYKITSEDIQHDLKVLDKRLYLAGVKDYNIKAKDDTIIINSNKIYDLSSILQAKGNFEVKLGNETIFTNKDLTYVCLDSVGCNALVYAAYNRSLTGLETEVVYNLILDISLTDTASAKFPELTKNLGIAKCEQSTCFLNDSLKFYLDGKYIGYEDISVTAAKMPLKKLTIKNEFKNKNEALHQLKELKYLLQGNVNLKNIEKSDNPSNYKVLFFSLLLLPLFILIFGSSFIIYKLGQKRTALYGILIGVSEIIFAYGILAVLNIYINLYFMILIILFSILTFVYQSYISINSAKESFSKRAIAFTNNKINKIYFILLAIAVLTVLFLPLYSIFVIIQALYILIVSKPAFIDRLNY